MIKDREKHFNYVKNFFQKNDCELLTNYNEYINDKLDLSFRCICGTLENTISFYKYSRSVYKSCNSCKNIKQKTTKKDFSEIIEYFNLHECKLLTEEKDYKGVVCKNINYLCKCGNQETTSFVLFSMSAYKKCKICKENLRKTLIKPYKEIENYFLKHNVKLITPIEDYIGSKQTRLSYMCPCGNIVKDVTYQSFFLSKNKKCNICVTKIVKRESFEKYGVEYPMKNIEVYNKSVKYRLKDFVFPSGKVEKVQGYENLALKILIEDYGYKEDDIVVANLQIPCFKYTIKSKTKNYIPDIFIISENKIIEVKSDRIFNIQRIQNTLKALSVRKSGYDFEFWIFSKVKKHNTPNYKYDKCYLNLNKM